MRPIRTDLAMEAFENIDADGYDVFFARCGTDFDGIYMTRSAEKTGCSIRGLEKKTLYKLRVLAFAMRGGEKEYIGEAFTARCMTGGGNKKHTNAKEIRIRADRIELNVGEKQDPEDDRLGLDDARGRRREPRRCRGRRRGAPIGGRRGSLRRAVHGTARGRIRASIAQETP